MDPPQPQSAPSEADDENEKDITSGDAADIDRDGDIRYSDDDDADDADESSAQTDNMNKKVGRIFTRKKSRSRLPRKRNKAKSDGGATAAAAASTTAAATTTAATGEKNGTNHNNNNLKDKQKRHGRQRAKYNMVQANQLMDTSMSDSDRRGLEPLDAEMEAAAALAQKVLPPRTRHHRRRKKNLGADGYENSGHETSDFLFTEDDKSDYFVTEDDKDDDDEVDNDVKDEINILSIMDTINIATAKLSIEGADGNDADNSTLHEDVTSTTCASPSRPPPLSPPQPPTSTPSKPRRKRGPRKRGKGKKGTQSVPEDPPDSTVAQDEENDATTTQGQSQQKAVAKEIPQLLSPLFVNCQLCSDQPQPQQLYNDSIYIDEDDDDYPAGMGIQKEDEVKEEQDEDDTAKKPKRTIEEELTFLERISDTRYQVQVGFVPNMKVPAEIIVNSDLQTLLVQELRDTCCVGPYSEAEQSFIPALRQAANVAALPGIVKASLAMPDVHSGYGFCIGNVAAFDMEDPLAVVSPGGVGFDINCGVRLIRTNLTEADISGDMKEKLAEEMFQKIPVGVGRKGEIKCTEDDLDRLLTEGVDWAVEKGLAWPEDRDHCEENGRMEMADPTCVSKRAKKRGLKQLGTLGAGNHYAEIQVVDEVYDQNAADTMGIGKVGQVCIMIHTGSRGLGHQVATDALTTMERAMSKDKIQLNDRQLSCARIGSREGKEYLSGMASAANFAWVNRSCITALTRKVFADMFKRTPEEMEMHLVYDVCHNIAKVEEHSIGGVMKKLLVHRKGSTRAFPPNHPNIPKDYQSIGQPVLIGGTMGTCSYVLVGTDKGMTETFGSTCHGAGRALSRNQSRKKLDHEQVLARLKNDGISIRVASPMLVAEEAPESYKNVTDVIDTCEDAGISRKVVKLRPVAVIKG